MRSTPALFMSRSGIASGVHAGGNALRLTLLTAGLAGGGGAGGAGGAGGTGGAIVYSALGGSDVVVIEGAAGALITTSTGGT